MSAPVDYASWLQRGTHVRLDIPAFAAGAVEIFAIDGGLVTGPHVTFLHGFPTSSFDWQPVFDLLAPANHLLCFDFLGFGDSDKPRAAKYSVHAQADLVEAMWAHFHVDRTVVVAHDFGVSVAQELLARRTSDNTKGIAGVTFLNGGIYPDLHRPAFIQKALLTPVLGRVVSLFASEQTFASNMQKLFSPEHQLSPAQLHEHWSSIERKDGHRIYDKLIGYLRDRREHEARWRTALEQHAIPKQFIWGMLDPISGAHMSERLKERIRPLRLVEMHDIGHYPQLEAPKRVAEAVAEWFPTR